MSVGKFVGVCNEYQFAGDVLKISTNKVDLLVAPEWIYVYTHMMEINFIWRTARTEHTNKYILHVSAFHT